MKLKILIAEDKADELQSSIKACKRLAISEGFVIEDDSIVTASSIDETIQSLEKKPFDFDIIILDIGFGEADFNVEKLSQYLKADTLAESKVIIHSGNPEFKTDADKILTAVCNGAKTIAIKGELNGSFSFDHQFKRILRDIKYEVIWANIGRFTPQWKRDLFRDDNLWKKLRTGKKHDKIFLLIDISNSTQFVIQQRKASIEDKYILELFKSFANLATDIIEQDCYRGIVERYSGDEILAYFDIDDSSENAYLKIIECADKINTEFLNKINELYKEYGFADVKSEQNTIKPELRILISCGEVMWILQGADSRPQLSIMTDKIAKFYRCFTDRDKNYQRAIEPNQIYVTHDVYLHIKNNPTHTFNLAKDLDLRDFGKLKIYTNKK